MSKTIQEKILIKEEQIKNKKEKILKEEMNIKKLEEEIQKLKNIEIQGLLKSVNLSHTELIEFIKDLKSETSE